MIAFAMPPPASPTGCGVCVKKSSEIAPAPAFNRWNRMNSSGSVASTAATYVSPIITVLRPCRIARRLTARPA
jgi:hypothetical protein